MMTVVERVLFLQNIDVFSRVPTEQLAYLAAIAEEIDTAAGEKVYAEGDVADAMYLVLHGQVRLHRGDAELLVAEPKAAFGTWALFDDQSRVSSATAVEESRLLKIDRDDFVDLLADHVQITQGVLKTMVNRLRGLMERVGVDNSQRS